MTSHNTQQNRQKAADLLRSCGIMPSLQRLAIYENLLRRQDHPTANQIYKDLAQAMPTLARATVYSTLHLLCENKLAKAVLGDGREMRFDADDTHRAHFHCNRCDSIFHIEATPYVPDDFPIPQGMMVTGVEVYLSGLCPKCAKDD